MVKRAVHSLCQQLMLGKWIPVQYARCVLPHVGLVGALLTYVVIGALLMMLTEWSADLTERTYKIQQVWNAYENVIKTAVTTECRRDKVRASLLPALSNLSMIHSFGRIRHGQWSQVYANQKTWNTPAALFYALTVTASTGFAGATPATDAGRIFTVIYGLFGIPLLFLTAADLGMFLSSAVTSIYRGIYKMKDSVRLWRRRALPPLTPGTDNMDDLDEISTTSYEQLQLPIYTSLLIILCYCALGSFLYNAAFALPGNKNFVYGLFFSFNAVSTVGLGPLDTDSLLLAFGVIVYSVGGLACITMCVELASLQVKAGFNRLHYYGSELHKALAIVKQWKHLKNGELTFKDLVALVEMYKCGRDAYAPEDIHLIKYIDHDSTTSSLISTGDIFSHPAYYKFKEKIREKC